MLVFAADPTLASLGAVWASAEAKAIEAASLLAAGCGLPVGVHPILGENDRSATGFLPPEEFEQVVDAVFAPPPHRPRLGPSANSDMRT